MENLLGRIELLERRLQLISDELSIDPARGAQDGEAAPAARGGEDAAPFATDVHIEADSISAFAHGFYQREYDSHGVMFRWTGSGPLCELRFFIDRGGDRQFRVNVGDTADDITSQVRGFVDYAPIQLTVEEEEGATYLKGVIPKRGHTRLAVLSFLLGELVAKKKPNPQASAWLGFKFYSLEAG